MKDYSEIAAHNFLTGYNCAQSVFLTFADRYNINPETALKLSSSFGGGMGRLREVCGAVSAMFMIAGLEKGYIAPADMEAKTQHYKLIQELANEFKSEFDTIICRELLGLPPGADEPEPSERTEEYYHSRPCEKFIRYAAKIIETKLLNERRENFPVKVKTHQHK